MGDDSVLMIATDEGWLLGLAEHAKSWGGVERELTDQDDTPLRPGHRRGWWIATERPTSVLWRKPEHRKVIGWTLANPALHDVDPDRWPLALPADHDRWDDDNSGRADYTAEIEATPGDIVPIDLTSATVLDHGRWRREVPRFDDDVLRRWSPDLAGSVLYSPELGPWLPGYLSGFRAHMATLLEMMPHVTDVYCKRPSSNYEPSDGPYFNVRQMWSDGRAAITGKGRQRHTQPTWITIKVPLSDVPRSIRGDDLWAAVEAWDAAEAEWLNRWDLIGAQACGNCNGRGWVRR